MTDDVKSLVTSLYLEVMTSFSFPTLISVFDDKQLVQASNCTTYIQDAFQLLQPVLQLNSLGAH